MPDEKQVRMDKWLWAVRVFKTRSLAAEACRRGEVSIDGRPVKAAREPKAGDVIVVKKKEITRTLKVLALRADRVGAPLVPQYLEDLTPPSEYQKKRDPVFQVVALRPKGAGRPTKKERRALEGLEF